MIKQIFALLALFASASAFVPAAPAARAAFGIVKESTTLSMAMQTPELKKSVAAAAAGFIPAMIVASPAFATEGTGEMFGVDDPILLGVLFLGHLFILSLWLGQYGGADEDVDFFGEIDYTKN
mmetsp:Transcript_4928/g.8658  ORF Transcript_4928/g.8658 Transcript_4928/m.8658 type:complete len:123 (-) Transcript_4928:220-588(-)